MDFTAFDVAASISGGLLEAANQNGHQSRNTSRRGGGPGFNLSCPGDPPACPICYETLSAWRPHQFSLYLAVGLISGLANLLVIMAMLRRGLKYSCHWYIVAIAISDLIHSACLAAITELIRAGGFEVFDGAAMCKCLYYAHFLCKSISSWTVLIMSAELCISLFRPFSSPVGTRLRSGVLLTVAELCALAAATSPRLVFVGPPNSDTDQANMLCSTNGGDAFHYYALFETVVLTYLLPVSLNLLLSVCSAVRLLQGQRRGQLTRALLITALASALFNAPHAVVLAANQLDVFKNHEKGLSHLGLCLYYATSAWSCLGVLCNLAIFITFNAAFRRSLILLISCPRMGKGRIN